MKTITVVGGNLFQLALQYLGDASQWNRIAQQNLSVLSSPIDPMLSGEVTLQIPSVNDSLGGGIFVPGS